MKNCSFPVRAFLRRLSPYCAQAAQVRDPADADAINIGVVIALRDSFAKESPAVRALFDALVDLLTGLMCLGTS